ncbi:MAG: hypothetical protein ACYC35_14695 [Pirellulales bacterium]
MMSAGRSTWFKISLVVGAAFLAISWATAAPPAAPKVSTFAPAEDLVAQVKYYVARVDEVVATEDEYTSSGTKLGKDANTLAVLALALGMHDQANGMKASAPALLKASQELAKTTDYKSAKSAAAAVKKAAAGGTASAALQWEKVATLPELMKQVPLVNTALKRGMTTASRFKSQATKSAGYSATLAVIAQAAMCDISEVKNPADTDKWYKFCADMRDGFGAVNAAIKKGDQKAASSGVTKLTKTCDDCHAVFHPVTLKEEEGGAGEP